MFVLISLITIHALCMIINICYAWKEEHDDNFIGFFIFMIIMSIIPVGSQIFTALALIDIHENNNKLNNQHNKIMECKDCGLYSRYGNMLINKLKTERMECPHCNNKGYVESKLDINTKLPLAPKLSIKQIKEYLKLKKQKEEFSLIDSQLDKYNELQQKKLNKSLDVAIDRLEKIK